MDKPIKFSVKYHFEVKTSSGHVARTYGQYFVHAASKEDAEQKTKVHAEAMYSARIGMDPKFLVMDEISVA